MPPRRVQTGAARASSHAVDTTPISAFAAARQAGEHHRTSALSDRLNLQDADGEEPARGEPKDSSAHDGSFDGQDLAYDGDDRDDGLESQPSSSNGQGNASKEIRMLSTWCPSPESVLGWRGEWLRLSISPSNGQDVRLTFIGQYRIRVVKGSIRLYGAILCAGPRSWSAFAPSSHALPCIASYGTEDAVFEVSGPSSSMEHLEPLSPLFRRLWNDPKTMEPPGLEGINNQGYSYLEYDRDDSLHRPLQVMDTEQSMTDFMDRFGMTTERPIVYVCGQQNAGKSTFCRALVNCATTASPPKGARRPVCYLDLDPGQTEFTPAAQVSLVSVREPLLGPPFAHPFPENEGGFSILKSHAVVTARYEIYSDRYTECCLDLIRTYHQIVENSSAEEAPSLVINTPAMSRGFGEEFHRVLVFIDAAAAKHIVYLGPSQQQTFQAIKHHAQARRILLHHWEPAKSIKLNRSAQHLRDMMMLSYFHAQPPREPSKKLQWHADQLYLTPRNVVHASFDGGATALEKEVGVELRGLLHMGRGVPHGHVQDIMVGNIAVVVHATRGAHEHLTWTDDDDCPQTVMEGQKVRVVASSRAVALCLVRQMAGGHAKLYSPQARELRSDAGDSETVLYRRQLERPAWVGLEATYAARWQQEQIRRLALEQGILNDKEVSLLRGADAAVDRRAAGGRATAGEAADAWQVPLRAGESEAERIKRQRAFEYGSAVWRGVPRGHEWT